MPDQGELTVVVAPDKFKGTLTAAQAAEAMSAGVRDAVPRASVRRLPVADGGDGTVAAAVAAGYSPVTRSVSGPTGRPVAATFAIGPAGGAADADGATTAVVELAAASGLHRLPGGVPAPRTAGTAGTGQLLRAALDHGAGRVVLGVGGSASTDGGTGMAAALGARFLDGDGADLPPGGVALGRLRHIDPTGLDPRLAGTEVVVASDVDNPLTGPSGAAAVYGPQKGATPQDVADLEAGLARLAEVVRRDLGVDVERLPGAGAAGGTGAGALALLGARLEPGIDLVLDLVGFADAVHGADLVLTGEGALDAQSLHGKAPYGVAQRAAKAGVPVLALAGRVDLDDAGLGELGVLAAYALTDAAPDQETAERDAATLLRRLTARAVREWLDRADAPDPTPAPRRSP
jgi:glycerate kinase